MEDYAAAAVRHYQNAQLLFEQQQLDNAGHLIGFAAECAIKHKITSLRPTGDSPHGHLPEILLTARKHLGQRANYSSMYDILKGDIFKTWNVNRRYAPTGNTLEPELTGWFDTTKRLLATANLRGSRNE